MKEQITQHFDPLGCRRVVNDLINATSRSPRHMPQRHDGASYALFAAGLPAGHIVQNYISDTAVVEPRVGGARTSWRRRRGRSPRRSRSSPTRTWRSRRPPTRRHSTSRHEGEAQAQARRAGGATAAPDHTTITVLNGNGVAGAAANAAYLLAQRGYVSVLPATARRRTRPTTGLLRHRRSTTTPATPWRGPPRSALDAS